MNFSIHNSVEDSRILDEGGLSCSCDSSDTATAPITMVCIYNAAKTISRPIGQDCMSVIR
jgi:hypothetical protein